MGRHLGLDVGTRRVGVALSDEGASIASPHDKIDVESFGQAAGEVARMVEEFDVETIVVGWPLEFDGTEGRAVDRTQRFIAKVREALDDVGRTPSVEKWDERMTSLGAENALLESDMSREKRRQVIDKVAASRILQSFLDRSS